MKPGVEVKSFAQGQTYRDGTKVWTQVAWF